MNHSLIEPRGYVRGGFGEEMDLACLSIASHFAALPGWQESQIDPHEVAYLAGFFAFIALVSSPPLRSGSPRLRPARRRPWREGSCCEEPGPSR